MVALIFWIVISFALIGFSFLLNKNNFWYDDWWKDGFPTILRVFSAVILILSISIFIDNDEFVKTFEAKSNYYSENYQEDRSFEDYELVQDKNKLNERLFHAQWEKERFGIFSLYSDDVMNLEPVR